MKTYLHNQFLKNDTVCVSLTKNSYTENQCKRLYECADSTVDIELPFTFHDGNKSSALSLFSFCLSKWFEEFEYVDSREKCLKFFERIADSGNGQGRKSYDYYTRFFGNYDRYDWSSNPLIFMISDKLLICDVLRIFDNQFCMIDPISYDNSIYETRTLWYILQQLIIYNRRPNIEIEKCKGHTDSQLSPIHDMQYHYGWDKCLNNKYAGLIGYSPRNVIRMMILHEFSQYNNAIRNAENVIAENKSKAAELNGNLAEIELKLSAFNY